MVHVSEQPVDPNHNRREPTGTYSQECGNSLIDFHIRALDALCFAMKSLIA